MEGLLVFLVYSFKRSSISDEFNFFYSAGLEEFTFFWGEDFKLSKYFWRHSLSGRKRPGKPFLSQYAQGSFLHKLHELKTGERVTFEVLLDKVVLLLDGAN